MSFQIFHILNIPCRGFVFDENIWILRSDILSLKCKKDINIEGEKDFGLPEGRYTFVTYTNAILWLGKTTEIKLASIESIDSFRMIHDSHRLPKIDMDKYKKQQDVHLFKYTRSYKRYVPQLIPELILPDRVYIINKIKAIWLKDDVYLKVHSVTNKYCLSGIKKQYKDLMRCFKVRNQKPAYYIEKSKMKSIIEERYGSDSRQYIDFMEYYDKF